MSATFMAAVPPCLRTPGHLQMRPMWLMHGQGHALLCSSPCEERAASKDVDEALVWRVGLAHLVHQVHRHPHTLHAQPLRVESWVEMPNEAPQSRSPSALAYPHTPRTAPADGFTVQAYPYEFKVTLSRSSDARAQASPAQSGGGQAAFSSPQKELFGAQAAGLRRVTCQLLEGGSSAQASLCMRGQAARGAPTARWATAAWMTARLMGMPFVAVRT